MSLVDIVKHALPMKLKDGKRHMWPTLASMVYFNDNSTLEDKIFGSNDPDAVKIDLEQVEDAGDIVLTNADLLDGMTLAELDTYFEKLRLDREHPVGGQPYITFLSADQDNPNTKWPWTSWTLDHEASGKFLLGANSDYPLGSDGGEETHKLTVSEMPKHFHNSYASYPGYSENVPIYFGSLNQGSYTFHTAATTDGGYMSLSTGGYMGDSMAHNNMPPYISVNIWKRTA